MTLGEAIRRAMGTRWTQEAVAEALGVRQASVSDWVTNKSQPGPDRLEKLEDLFGLPRGHFLIATGRVDPGGDPDIAAMGVDLAELRALDPEMFERALSDSFGHAEGTRRRRPSAG